MDVTHITHSLKDDHVATHLPRVNYRILQDAHTRNATLGNHARRDARYGGVRRYRLEHNSVGPNLHPLP